AQAPSSVGEFGCRAVFSRKFVVETPFYLDRGRDEDIHMVDLNADGHSLLTRRATSRGFGIQTRVAPTAGALPRELRFLSQGAPQRSPWSLYLLWNRHPSEPLELRIADHLRAICHRQSQTKEQIWSLLPAARTETEL